MTKKILACVCAVLLLIGGFLAGRLSAPKIKTEPPAEPVTTNAPEVTEPEPEPEPEETTVVRGYLSAIYGNHCFDLAIKDSDEVLHIPFSTLRKPMTFESGIYEHEEPNDFIQYGVDYDIEVTLFDKVDIEKLGVWYRFDECEVHVITAQPRE